MLLVLFQALCCLLIADFITGLVHWWEDTYATKYWKGYWKIIAEPNIIHHKDPKAMIRDSNSFQRCALSGIFAIIIVSLIYFFYGINWQIILTAIFSTIGNEVHGWHHGLNIRNPIVKFLQDMCLVQTPKHHSMHHRQPYNRDYCILTNWLNPILNRIKFWRMLEWLISLFGIKVKRMTEARDYV